MGHDVISIGQHNLKLETTKDLAEELSHRFGVTVKYGFISCNDNWEDIFNEEGVAGDVDEGKELWVLEQDWDNSNKNAPPYFNFYAANNRETYIQILAGGFRSDIHFDSRWWNFNHAFMEDETYLHNEMIFHRKCVMQQVKLLGGNMAFYIDDQGPSAKAEDLLEHTSFIEVQHWLEETFMHDLLNISHFMKNGFPNKKEYLYKAFLDDFKDL